jgi:aspartyl-tRNA(Asn)/glutamyl-tRNA(Gln) amidotransferase subunit C
MANYTRDDIRHVARLAHLEISETEISARVCEFNRLIGMFEKLNDLQTDDISPTSRSSADGEGSGTPMVEDRVTPSLPPREALANAPSRQDEFFLVPRMIGEGE